MIWSNVYRHIMQEFEDIEDYKSSATVFLGGLCAITEMFVRKHAIIESMYLDKNCNGKEILIPGKQAVKLKQLERDGLRFLYRHFKKKSLGAIMNDPPCHSKIVQEILLLQSLQSVLDPNYPCLVITNATNIQDWKHIFSLFYENYENDVIFEPKSVYEDKKIIVYQGKHIRNYTQRKWSIVIVDDRDITNDSKTYMTDLKLLNADFKIWNCSLKIPKELNQLKIIYNYIYQDLLDTEYLKTIGYAHFMNIVGEFCLTRDTPGQDDHMMDIDEALSPVSTTKVSKKNKDSTGTKIKSSKKRRLASENKEEAAMSQSRPSNNLMSKSQDENLPMSDKARDNNCNFVIFYKYKNSSDEKIPNLNIIIPNGDTIMNKNEQSSVEVKVNELNEVSNKKNDAEIIVNNDNNDLIAPLKLEVDFDDNKIKDEYDSFDKTENDKDASKMNTDNEDLMAPLRLETDCDVTNSGNEMDQNESITEKSKQKDDLKNSYENNSLEFESNSIDICVNNKGKNENKITKELINSNKSITNNVSSTTKDTIFDDYDEGGNIIIGDKSMYEKILNQFF